MIHIQHSKLKYTDDSSLQYTAHSTLHKAVNSTVHNTLPFTLQGNPKCPMHNTAHCKTLRTTFTPYCTIHGIMLGHSLDKTTATLQTLQTTLQEGGLGGSRSKADMRQPQTLTDRCGLLQLKCGLIQLKMCALDKLKQSDRKNVARHFLVLDSGCQAMVTF